MHIPRLLAKKRDGHALEQNEIEWFIHHLHQIPNEQIGAFLMACQINGLNAQETNLTWCISYNTSNAAADSGESTMTAHGDLA